jgi:hypothetical protein
MLLKNSTFLSHQGKPGNGGHKDHVRQRPEVSWGRSVGLQVTEELTEVHVYSISVYVCLCVVCNLCVLWMDSLMERMSFYFVQELNCKPVLQNYVFDYCQITILLYNDCVVVCMHEEYCWLFECWLPGLRMLTCMNGMSVDQCQMCVVIYNACVCDNALCVCGCVCAWQVRI